MYHHESTSLVLKNSWKAYVHVQSYMSMKSGSLLEEDIEWKTKCTSISRLLDITLQKCIMFIPLPWHVN